MHLHFRSNLLVSLPDFANMKKQHRPTKVTNIPNRTSIHERPAEANGKRFGDWEMDLIVDSCLRVILNWWNGVPTS